MLQRPILENTKASTAHSIRRYRCTYRNEWCERGGGPPRNARASRFCFPARSKKSIVADDVENGEEIDIEVFILWWRCMPIGFNDQLFYFLVSVLTNVRSRVIYSWRKDLCSFETLAFLGTRFLKALAGGKAVLPFLFGAIMFENTTSWKSRW